MVGNVQAIVAGNSLIVKGDDGGTLIAISQPGAGQFTLKGEEGTTINGSDQPQSFQRVTRDVVINLGKGDYFVVFDQSNSITVGGSLIINGGNGINSVFTDSFEALGTLNVGGNLTINNVSAGGALTTLVNVSVGGDLRVQSSRGSSSVIIGTSQAQGVAPFQNTIGGSLIVTNGTGDVNHTDLNSLNVRRDVIVQNQGTKVTTFIHSDGSQNSVGGQLQVMNGPGEFETTVVDQTKVSKSVEIRTSGGGQNNVVLHTVNIQGNTNIVGTRGTDWIDVNEATFGGSFQLQTGLGADRVEIGTSAVKRILVTLLVPEQRTKYIERNGVQIPVTYIVLHPVFQQRTVSTLGTFVTFKGSVAANLGVGDDTLDLAADATLSFNKEATFDGQVGMNTATINTANLPVAPKVKRFQINSP